MCWVGGEVLIVLVLLLVVLLFIFLKFGMIGMLCLLRMESDILFVDCEMLFELSIVSVLFGKVEN